jgi:Flp pilus assembly protein TadG
MIATTTPALEQPTGGLRAPVVRFSSRLGARRRGVAAAELALLAPVLTTLLVIALDYGRIFYYDIMVMNCARNGAQWAADPVAASQSPYSTVTAAAQADWPSSLTPLPTVSQGSNGTDSEGNSYATVTVTWQFTTITSYLGLSSQNLSSTMRMRVAPKVPN